MHPYAIQAHSSCVRAAACPNRLKWDAGIGMHAAPVHSGARKDSPARCTEQIGPCEQGFNVPQNIRSVHSMSEGNPANYSSFKLELSALVWVVAVH